MDIKLIKTSDYSESCNFCGKGEREGIKEVLAFSKSNVSGIKAIICKECLEELYKEGMNLFEA